MIHLTYSPTAVASGNDDRDLSYLDLLKNQREELKNAVELAPRYRLDNLAAYIETHSHRLAHLLEALISYRKRARKRAFKSWSAGAILSLLIAVGVFAMSRYTPLPGPWGIYTNVALGGIGALLALLLWRISLNRLLFNRFHKKTLKNIDQLTTLSNQTRRDSWEAVRHLVARHLRQSGGRFSLKEVRREFSAAWHAYEKSAQEIREALKELESLPPDEQQVIPAVSPARTA